MSELGQQIKQARIESGRTQAQLADEMHVTRQTISNWENGRSVPDYVMLGQLAQILQLDTALAMTEATEQPPKEISFKRWLVLLALAAVLVIGILAAVYGFAPKSPYTVEWFFQTQTAEEGRAFVRTYSLEAPVKSRHNRPEATPIYQFGVFMKEENGVGCTITDITLVYFIGSRVSFVDSLAQEDFLHISLGSPYIGANQYRRMALSFPAGKETGIGFWISGTDDNGNALESKYYLPLVRE